MKWVLGLVWLAAGTETLKFIFQPDIFTTYPIYKYKNCLAIAIYSRIDAAVVYVQPLPKVFPLILLILDLKAVFPKPISPFYFYAGLLVTF